MTQRRKEEVRKCCGIQKQKKTDCDGKNPSFIQTQALQVARKKTLSNDVQCSL